MFLFDFTLVWEKALTGGQDHSPLVCVAIKEVFANETFRGRLAGGGLEMWLWSATTSVFFNGHWVFLQAHRSFHSAFVLENLLPRH